MVARGLVRPVVFELNGSVVLACNTPCSSRKATGTVACLHISNLLLRNRRVPTRLGVSRYLALSALFHLKFFCASASTRVPACRGLTERCSMRIGFRRDRVWKYRFTAPSEGKMPLDTVFFATESMDIASRGRLVHRACRLPLRTIHPDVVLTSVDKQFLRRLKDNGVDGRG